MVEGEKHVIYCIYVYILYDEMFETLCHVCQLVDRGSHNGS